MPVATAHVPRSRLWIGHLVVMVCVVLSCLVGIHNSPTGSLSAFWPTNAVLLGLLLRYPAWARDWRTWLFAALAYVATDLATGTAWRLALGLSLANLCGVLSGWLYLSHQPHEVLRLERQHSLLHLLAGCAIAALGSTLLGAPWGHWYSQVPLVQEAVFWVSAELFCYLLILPLFLCAPRAWPWQWQWPSRSQLQDYTQYLPLLALLATEVLTYFFNGPGFLGFSIPAMVWCAMVYGVFPTALLNLLLCSWKVAAVDSGLFGFAYSDAGSAASLRLGMALLSLAPLAVACAYALRLQALNHLRQAVDYDFLTGVLTRRALIERGHRLLSRLQHGQRPVAVLMLDIDHFKHINDRHGHAQGDVVLQTFATLVGQTLRPEDLLGRMGGEEFVIILPDTQREHALTVALRICERLRKRQFPLPGSAPLQITLSIGLYATAAIGPQDSMEQMLSKADAALYLAKNNGRNQVRLYEADACR